MAVGKGKGWICEGFPRETTQSHQQLRAVNVSLSLAGTLLGLSLVCVVYVVFYLYKVHDEAFETNVVF